jgi:WS/DGAT/MGAT family acyltransferase
VSRPTALSPLEAAFIHVESERSPIHLATVAFFDGAPLRDARGVLDLARVRARIDGRLHLTPKLRRRVHRTILPGAPPVWLDDPTFDIADHVTAVHLDRPGSDRQFWDLAAELLGRPLDPDHPRWHFCFVDGLADGRIGAVLRIHHSLADGLAGIEVATLLFDVDAGDTDPAPTTDVPGWDPARRPWVGLEAVQDVVRLNEIGLRWLGRGVHAARHPVATLHGAGRLLGAVGTLVSGGLGRSTTSLNRPIGDRRRLAVVREPFDAVASLAHAYDVTVNDVMLTVVGGAVADLLAHRGERPPPELLVCIPVGLVPDQRDDLGNLVSAWMVRIPVGTDDPVGRLSEVAVATGSARSHHEELVAEAAMDLVRPFPQSVVSGVVRLVDHQPLVNLIVTNVPGPPFPLYLLGALLEEAYPFVPLAGNLTVGVAMLSYDGWLSLGILADDATCPDVEVFGQAIGAQLRALESLSPLQGAAESADS